MTLTQEWMLKTLVNLGFRKEQAEVYVFLATSGPKKASDIAEELRIHKRRLYRILRSLENKGLTSASSDYPALFSAVLFEKALDLFVEAKMEQQKALWASKEELLSTWRALIEKKRSDS